MKFRRNTEPGFTLLELLAAMAVLSVMIVMLFAAFSQASRAWLIAENRVETFTQARAALDLMSRELSQTITTSNISFLGSATNIAFIAPINTIPGDVVDLQEVVYRWTGTNLERQATPFSAPGGVWDFYSFPQTWPKDATAPVTVADNVVSVELGYVYANGTTDSFWNSNSSTLLPGPYWSKIPSSLSAFAQGGMTSRPPAGVKITLGTIDTRGMTRLRAIAPFGTNSFPATIGPFTNAFNQMTRYFTTYVPIPNGQQ
jgi:prepilin-type N-terminal cleavage/methylation domain-containing protein